MKQRKIEQSRRLERGKMDSKSMERCILKILAILALLFAVGGCGSREGDSCQCDEATQVCLPDSTGQKSCQPKPEVSGPCNCDPQTQICVVEASGQKSCQSNPEVKCRENGDCKSNYCEKNDGEEQGVCRIIRSVSGIQCRTKKDCQDNISGIDSNKLACLKTLASSSCVQKCTVDLECPNEQYCLKNYKQEGYCAPDRRPALEVQATQRKCIPKSEINEVGVDKYSAFISLNFPNGIKSGYLTAWPTVANQKAKIIGMVLANGNIISFVNDYPDANYYMTTRFGGLLSGILLPMIPSQKRWLAPGKVTYVIETNKKEDVCTQFRYKKSLGRKLDLNIYLVGLSGIKADNAMKNKGIKALFDKIREIFKKADIDLGKIRFYDAPKAVAKKYSVYRFDNAAGSTFGRELVATSVLPAPSDDDALSLNVFMVKEIAGKGAPLGISPAIAGPPGIHGTATSGIVFSTILLNNNKYYDLALKPGLKGEYVKGSDYTAVLMAHEMGHFLGLFHTTDEPLHNLYDPLDDTPKCSAPVYSNKSSFYIDCPDSTNLMFPYAGSSHTEITNDQKTILKHSTLLK